MLLRQGKCWLGTGEQDQCGWLSERLKYDVKDEYRRENRVLKEKLHQPPIRFVHEQNIMFLTGKHSDHHGTLVISDTDRKKCESSFTLELHTH
jgi:hypothetical protein